MVVKWRWFLIVNLIVHCDLLSFLSIRNVFVDQSFQLCFINNPVQNYGLIKAEAVMLQILTSTGSLEKFIQCCPIIDVLFTGCPVKAINFVTVSFCIPDESFINNFAINYIIYILYVNRCILSLETKYQWSLQQR